MLELNRRVSADLPLTRAETEAWRRWIPPPSTPEEEEEGEEEAHFLVPLRGKLWRRLVCVFADFWNVFFCGVTSSAAYGSSSAVSCAWLVFLVLLLSLYSFLRSSGPRCSTP